MPSNNIHVHGQVYAKPVRLYVALDLALLALGRSVPGYTARKVRFS